MTSKDIQKALWNYYCNSKYLFSNIYIGNFEADFVVISNSGYTSEIEIKISRVDFFNDFKKGYGNINKHEKYDSDNTNIPNKFYFAVPKDLLKLDEIPKYCGLIEIDIDSYSKVKITKPAPFLHKEILLNKNWFTYLIMKKLYWKNQVLRRELNIRDYDIQKRIEFK